MKLNRRTVLGAALSSVATPALAAARSYRAYIPGPWGQIHVRVAGEGGRRTMFLLHKMVWSSDEFRQVQPLFAARGVRTIAIDIPGYGFSDGPADPPQMDAYADAMIPVIDHFELRKAVWLGDHTGGSIAAAVADRHPDRVERLIVDGPAIFEPKVLADILAQPHYDQALASDGSHLLKRWRSVKAGLPPGPVSAEALHEAVALFFQAGPNEWYAHEAVFRYDLEACLKRLKVPSLVMSNKGDTLYEAAQKVRAMRPVFAYAEVDWAGSQAMFDAPRPWSDAVIRYLETPP